MKKWTETRIDNSRIAKKFIAALVGVSTLITVVTTGIQLYADYDRDVGLIREDFTRIESSHLRILANSLWVVDEVQIKAQLGGFLQLPDVEYAAVSIGDETRWSLGERQSKKVIGAELPIIFKHRDKELQIGVLNVLASLDAVYARLWDKFLIILAGNGVKTFLVAGFLFYLFQRLITHRVNRLAQNVQNLDFHTPTLCGFSSFAPAPHKKQDELDRLGGAIDDMYTRIVRDQHKLQVNEERFRAVFEQAAVGIAQIGLDGRWLRVNQKLCEITGYKQDFILRSWPQDLTHPEDLEQEMKQFQQILDGNIDIFHMEKRCLRKDGTVVWTKLSVSMVKDDLETPQYLVLILEDISKRKRAEDQAQQLTNELENRVAERSAELEAVQDKLLRNERLATLGQLTGTVAHELRNPLTSLVTSLRLVELKARDAALDIEKPMERINRGAQRCDAIITELLDFTRAKSLELEPTEIDDWMQSILEEIAVQDSISLRVEFNAADEVANFDRERLRRALINVVDNACQAMTDIDNPAKGGQLVVKTHVDNDRVEIEIIDSGPGVAPDVLPKIFEPLFSTKTFGVGLGLPTVRQIMEEHSGGIEISNNDEGGARTLLWLPVPGKDSKMETAA